MSELETIVKELWPLKELAARDTEGLPFNTRSGLEAAIKDARGRLPDLLGRYGASLLQNARGVFVTGSREQTTTFAAIPASEGESFTLDAEALYRSIADRMEPSLANTAQRQLATEQVVLLITALRTIGSELNADVYVPSVNEFPILPDFQSLVGFVRKVVRNTMGDALNRVYLRNALIQSAAEVQYSKPSTNVVVVNATFEESENLTNMFNQGALYIDIAPEDVVDPKYVSDKLRGSKSKKKNA